MNFIKTYVTTFLIFLLIDMIWLGLVAKNIYSKYLGYLMAPNINWAAALIFYALFVAGIIFFVINPAIAKNSLQFALLAGAFFGLITYATYDLTNLATVKDWPLTITIIDLLWGTTLGGATSAISFTILTNIFKIKN